jgi:malonyl-CoA O-methyltransferase
MKATPSTHRQQVSARFSAAARTYTEVSQLQDRVAARVMDLLPGDLSPDCLMDAGCGPGRLLMLAKKRWPEAACYGVDIAPGMIALARHQCHGQSNVFFIEADLNEYSSAIEFDLVISSSALHWLRPFSAGLAHVAGLVKRGGLVAIGVMLDGTLAEIHAARAAVAPDKKPTSRLVTFTELEAAARSLEGFRVRRIERTLAEYDLESAANVLRTIHEMGVTSGDISRGALPLSRHELAALTEWYDKNFATANGVRVTFSVGYLLLEREM